MKAVSITSLEMMFGEKQLWKNLDFEFHSGKIYGLVGPSGCGKSTLLNSIGGLIKPTAGRIEIAGKQTQRFSARKWRQFRADTLGFLFQNYALIEDSTIFENLVVSVKTSLFDRKPSKKAMRDALAAVGLDQPLETKVATLSGGEQQRLAIARLQLKRKQLILVDEPTAALDQGNSEKILDLLRELSDLEACVIIATHDPLVMGYCDELLHLG